MKWQHFLSAPFPLPIMRVKGTVKPSSACGIVVSPSRAAAPKQLCSWQRHCLAFRKLSGYAATKHEFCGRLREIINETSQVSERQRSMLLLDIALRFHTIQPLLLSFQEFFLSKPVFCSHIVLSQVTFQQLQLQFLITSRRKYLAQ